MTATINHGSLVGNNKRRRTSQAELARQRLPVPAVSECSAEFPRNFVFKALSAARVADALTNFWRNLRGNFPCKSLNVVLAYYAEKSHWPTRVRFTSSWTVDEMKSLRDSLIALSDVKGEHSEKIYPLIAKRKTKQTLWKNSNLSLLATCHRS